MQRTNWLAVAATAWLMAVPKLAAAQTWGWLWSGDSGGSGYSFNSLGAKNTSTRLEAGKYEVNLGLIGTDGGNVQVTAYGSDGRYCKVESWGVANEGVRAIIKCYGADGARKDTNFVVTYTKIPGTTGESGGAYVWSNVEAPTLNQYYKPNATYAWNSSGKPIEIKRTATGSYKVKFHGQTTLWGEKSLIDAGGIATNSVALATAYGPGNKFCQVGDIIPTATDTSVMVHCWANPASPTRADSMFTLAYGVHAPFLAAGVGFMHEACSNIKPKTANVLITGRPSSDMIESERIGTGRYRVNFPGLIAWNSSAAMVVANSDSTSRRCSIVQWGGSSNGTSVEIACFDKGGRAADSKCDVVYGTSQLEPLSTGLN